MWRNHLSLAQQLVRAKDVQEVLKLQGDFIRTQMQLLSEQARELGESAGRRRKMLHHRPSLKSSGTNCRDFVHRRIWLQCSKTRLYPEQWLDAE